MARLDLPVPQPRQPAAAFILVAPRVPLTWPGTILGFTWWLCVREGRTLIAEQELIVQ